MAILDFITGGNAKRAAARNTASINQGLAAGTQALNEGTNRATTLLGVDLGDGSNALNRLGEGYGQARDDIQQGYGQQQTFLGQLGEQYEPLVQSGQAALGARDDAMGLNGAEGYGRAKTALENSLGYGAGLNTGLDAVMRSAAARGMLGSGNTSRDLFEYGADYQNRQAGSYLDRLTNASQNLNQGIAGRAAGLQLQAGAAGSLGSNLGNLGVRQGESMSDLYRTGASVFSNLGSGIANLNNAATQQRIGNSNMLSDGEGKASSNLFNLAKSVFSAGNLASFLK